MIILRILFFIAFFAGYYFFVVYAFRGESGMLFLRRRAEESGDYERVKKLHFLSVAVRLISALEILFLLVCGLAVLISKDRVGADRAGDNSLLIVLIMLAGFGVFFLAATAMRLRIRRMMLREEESGGEPPLPEEFRVSYTNNPGRINNLMLWVVLLVFLLAFAVISITSPYVSPVLGIVFGVLILVIIAVLLIEVYKEHRDVRVLFVLDRKGIQVENPEYSDGFIPWRLVRDVSVSDKMIQLTLNRTLWNDPDRHEVVNISLDRTPISGDTILKKIGQYRLAAEQTEQPEE